MNKVEINKTNNVLATAFMILFYIFRRDWLFIVGIFFLVGNAFETRLHCLIATCWIKFARFVGELNNRIILSLMFFLVLTPVAVLYRFFNPWTVEHFLKNSKGSFFDDTTVRYTKESFHKQW